MSQQFEELSQEIPEERLIIDHEPVQFVASGPRAPNPAPQIEGRQVSRAGGRWQVRL